MIELAVAQLAEYPSMLVPIIPFLVRLFFSVRICLHAILQALYRITQKEFIQLLPFRIPIDLLYIFDWARKNFDD
jgi:hypothetical protein